MKTDTQHCVSTHTAECPLCIYIYKNLVKPQSVIVKYDRHNKETV